MMVEKLAVNLEFRNRLSLRRCFFQLFFLSLKVKPEASDDETGNGETE